MSVSTEATSAAIALLDELKGVSWIPAYNASGVRTVEERINELYQWVMSTIDELQGEDGDEEENRRCRGDLLVLHNCLERNKRAVLAYLKHRIDHVLQLRWEMATPQVPQELQDLLSQPELDGAREYDELLQTYMDAVGTDLCKCMQPPKSVRIAVKAKENWGEFMTESGSFNLQKNTVAFMKRDEVEPLIRQGVLEQLQTSVQ